ncbi:MAG: tetratricopeptide repeat protein [Desulfovibrio sp.]|nr:tetratricopeptide repeat protein [Desulfovibrio sp.]
MSLHDLIEACKIICKATGYEKLNALWRRSIKGMMPSKYFIFSIALSYIVQNKNSDLETLCKDRVDLAYFASLKAYLKGNFSLAIDILKKFLFYFPKHEESYFLLADSYISNNNITAAKQVLFNKVIRKRKKIWLKLANAVQNEDQYSEFTSMLWASAQVSPSILDDPVLLSYQALAAQRCQRYSDAINIWRKVSRIKSALPLKKKYKIRKESARQALADLITSTRQSNLELFLISGSLLGFLREGDFLEHDTDLDTGIFAGFDQSLLKKAIYNAGCFIIMPQRSQHCLRVLHVNGIYIDIFTHYRDSEDYWHSGVKVSWHNSPFALRRENFKGLEILIPDPPEKYLEENYGMDWTIPKQNFDSALDCPNGQIINKYEMEIHRIIKNIESNR